MARAVLQWGRGKKPKKPKRERTEVSRTFGMGTSGPHVGAQPGGKAACCGSRQASFTDILGVHGHIHDICV